MKLPKPITRILIAAAMLVALAAGAWWWVTCQASKSPIPMASEIASMKATYRRGTEMVQFEVPVSQYGRVLEALEPSTISDQDKGQFFSEVFIRAHDGAVSIVHIYSSADKPGALAEGANLALRKALSSAMAEADEQSQKEIEIFRRELRDQSRNY